MIRVTVDLISAIHPSRSRRLGTIEIANDGTGTKTKANYNATFYGPAGRPARRAHVADYPRNAVSVFNLLRRALTAAGYDK